MITREKWEPMDTQEKDAKESDVMQEKVKDAEKLLLKQEVWLNQNARHSIFHWRQSAPEVLHLA